MEELLFGVWTIFKAILNNFFFFFKLSYISCQVPTHVADRRGLSLVFHGHWTRSVKW